MQQALGMDSATFSEYLEDLLAEKGDGAGEVVLVPKSLCVATLSVLQYLTEDLQPSPIPAELMPSIVRLNNLLGDALAEESG
jgi:hypothetical protein